LKPTEIPSIPYTNPIHIALAYKEAIESQKVQNQAELAKSLNVTRSRVNQYLRLLKLPESIQDDVRSGRVKLTERRLRKMVTAL